MKSKETEATSRQTLTDLIMEPLQAAYDAQAKLASATAKFIEEVGFLPLAPGEESNTPSARTVAFLFDRPAADQSGSGNGAVATEQVALNVPLLSIVKIPNLNISKIDFTFAVNERGSDDPASEDLPVGEKLAPRYTVQVHAEQGELPEALARVLEMMAAALVPQPVAQPLPGGKSDA